MMLNYQKELGITEAELHGIVESLRAKMDYVLRRDGQINALQLAKEVLRFGTEKEKIIMMIEGTRKLLDEFDKRGGLAQLGAV